MKTTVHLVRHGEVHNPDGIFYGRIPGFFLSENGKKQVRRLGKHLSSKPVQKIYASPLDRTKQTALILLEFFPKASVEYDDRLIEVHSPLQGQPLIDLATTNWNFYDDSAKQGGETLLDIWNRMSSFFDEIIVRHSSEEVIVVSHGDPIMITATKQRGLPLEIRSIRSEFYVATAHGVQLTFNTSSTHVKDIKPPTYE